MKKKTIKAYMLRGIDEETVFKECIKNGFLILLFSGPVIVLSMEKILFIILGIVPNIVYLITVLRLHEEGTVKGVSNILYNGILALCLSYLSAMISLEIVFNFFEEDEKFFVIGMMVLGYIVVVLLFRYIIKRNIEKSVHTNEEEKIKGTPTVGVLLGTIMAKVIFKNMDQLNAARVACFIFMLISFCFLIGIFDIFQYIYLMRHKELIEGLDEDMKE